MNDLVAKMDWLFLITILGISISEGANNNSVPYGIVLFFVGTILYYLTKAIWMYLDAKK